MRKVLQELRLMVTTISLFLLPMLGFLTIVSVMEQHLLASLGYGTATLVWCYALYRLMKLSKNLKDDKKK